MDVIIPVYLVNILKCCGYDNCHTIATIVDADIEYFTDEVRKGGLNKFYGESAEALMQGCATSGENFVFMRGHVKLLQAIVKAVKDTLEMYGSDGFLLKLPNVASKVKVSSDEKETSVYRKRFKFSTGPSTSAQVHNGASDLASEEACSYDVTEPRNILIRKAIMILITRTPNLFANVSIL